MTAGYRADPETGEAIPFTAEDIRLAAVQYVAAAEAVDEAKDELRRLEMARDGLAAELRVAMKVGTTVNLGDCSVVVEPGYQGRRSVNPQAAQEYAEQLATVGLGGYFEEYRAPTLADVNRERARVIAAGVPLDRLILEPLPGPHKVTVVRKGL